MTVMFLLLLGLFLTFAAFAIDLGNMYLWQLRMDKAARAGALAGLGARGLRGWTATDGNRSIIENAAQTAVSENLLSYASASDGSSLPQGFATNTDWNSYDDSLGVRISYDMPTILVGRISRALGYGFGDMGSEPNSGRPIAGPAKIGLYSYQTAQVSRANVVLMLDVSGSMLCPVKDPPGYRDPRPCACRRDADPNACQISATNPTKLERMAQGVTNFVSQFNRYRDRITVIPFNLAARNLLSFTEYRQNNGPGSTEQATLENMQVTANITNSNGTTAVPAGTSAWDLLTNVTTLTAGLTALAGSNTNHCDALAEGIRNLESLSADILGAGGEADRRKLQPFVVFFTDGAPNAMRGIFPNTSTNPGGDFYHYALEWVVPNPVPTASPFTYRGPGPFVLRANDTNNPSLVQPLFRYSITAGSVAPTGSTTCGQPQTAFYDFEKTVTQNTTGARGSPTGCLTTSTFNFSIPYTNFDPQGSPTTTYQAQVQSVPISTATTTWRDPNWPPTSTIPPAYGLQKYDELPYYCAIEAADYLRLHFGATIFAIGLGPTNAHSMNGFDNDASCNDPLMDADDHSGRKDFFLSRLAFSRQIFTNQLLPTTISTHYQINVPHTSRTVSQCARHRYKTPSGAPSLNVGYVSPATNHSSTSSLKYDNLADAFKALRPFKPPALDEQNNGTSGANYRRIDTQGEYFPTNDASEVPSIFSNIAKIILLRSTT